MNIDNNYIIDGITIEQTEDGYEVFTIPTQWFEINKLSELTNDRILLQIKLEREENITIEKIERMFSDCNKKFKEKLLKKLTNNG